MKSLIMDALDDRTRDRADGPSEEEVVAVLREMGSPREVAARYAPSPRYVIGPELYQPYLTVAGIALGAVALAITIAHAVGFTVDPSPGGEVILKILSSVISGGISAIGSVTIVFALLERFLPDKEKDALVAATGEWDPRRLPPISRKESVVKLSEPVITLFFTLAALVIFNLFAQRIGAYYADETGWRFAAIFQHETVGRFLPFWNALWMAELIHQGVLLFRREWSVPSRVLQIVLSAAGAVLLAFMVGENWIRPEGFLALRDATSADGLVTLADLIAGGLRVGLVVAALGATGETIAHIVRLVRSISARRAR